MRSNKDACQISWETSGSCQKISEFSALLGRVPNIKIPLNGNLLNTGKHLYSALFVLVYLLLKKVNF